LRRRAPAASRDAASPARAPLGPAVEPPMAAGGTCAKVVVILAAIAARCRLRCCGAGAVAKARVRRCGRRRRRSACRGVAPRAARGCQPGARSKGRPSWLTTRKAGWAQVRAQIRKIMRRCTHT
jgi:hypothetical protein